MDVLPSGNLFRELEHVTDTGYFELKLTLEDCWQQVSEPLRDQLGTREPAGVIIVKHFLGYSLRFVEDGGRGRRACVPRTIGRFWIRHFGDSHTV